MVIWIAMAIHINIPCIKSLSGFINNKNEIIFCEIDSSDKSSFLGANYVNCKDKKNIIGFAYMGPLLEKGTKITVKYYKHINIGEIIRIHR